MNTPAIMSLSPRAGGNSDQAASFFARSLAGPSQTVLLREHRVEPCIGCGACAADGVCRVYAEDHAEALFARLDQASGLLVTAPVYFYHLPSQAKAWIDRSQARYLARECGRSARRKIRTAYLILIAGRTQGERLFAGILPTMRYFMDVLDFRIKDTLCLRGLDQAGDFSRDSQAVTAVRELAGRSGW
jgi:multimeric flavodoxin WrbA